MDLKKSIFSYIVWAVFAPLCCLGIVSALERAGITEMLGLPLYGIVGAVCVYLLLTAAVFFALRTIAMEIRRHIRDRKKAEAVFSVLLPVAILTGAAAYLVLYLVFHTPLALADDSFYRLALVSGDGNVSFMVHGTSWLYTHLLHVMLLLFGNTPFAGVVLQIVLFFICLLFFYIGMQAFAGPLPAAVSMASLGFLPVSLRYVFSLTPELFYLALYLLGFSLVEGLYRKFRQEGIVSPVQYIPVFLTGISIGFLIYLDLYGLSLYLFLAVLFSADKEKRGQAAMAYIVSLLGSICGFLLSVVAACTLGGISFSAYLRELVPLYISEVVFEAELSRFISCLPDVTLGGSVLLISLSFFIIPGFFLWKRGQCSAFIVNLFLVYGLAGISVFYLDMQMAVTFAWSVLAGAGVYGVVRTAGEEMMEEAVKKEDDGDEKESGTSEEVETGEEEKTGDLKMKTGKKAKKNVQSKKKKSSVKQAEQISTDSEIPVKTSSENKKEQEKPAPGEPLHNPLPVPKRKVRPQADFGYPVEEAEMKFDLDVTDQDDFDW